MTPESTLYVPAFSMKQRVTLMANKYELIAANPDGSDGPLLAFVADPDGNWIELIQRSV